MLICGSGVGASVAANKIPGIRASVCHDCYSAHQGVEHDNMNILVFGARVIGSEVGKELARIFIAARFSGEERHVRRLAKSTRWRSATGCTCPRAAPAPRRDNRALGLGRVRGIRTRDSGPPRQRESRRPRRHRGDYTLWKPQPTEITNRLGWLTIADRMTARSFPRSTDVVNAVRADGYTDALVLGMGGSSLAPEVFRQTFGVAAGYLDLAVLDSTDPDAVASHARRLDPARTLFVVSTKSGGTVETFSFFRFFYRWTVRALGTAAAGRAFHCDHRPRQRPRRRRETVRVQRTRS